MVPDSGSCSERFSQPLLPGTPSQTVPHWCSIHDPGPGPVPCSRSARSRPRPGDSEAVLAERVDDVVADGFRVDGDHVAVASAVVEGVLYDRLGDLIACAGATPWQAW